MVAYSFKEQFIEPIEAGDKTQTLRAFGRRRHARAGETLQLYTAMRTKQCRKLGTSLCDRVRGVFLKFSMYPAFYLFDIVETDPGRYRRRGKLMPISDLDAFARNDGFAHFDAMAKFWHDVHGVSSWEGCLIGWTDFRKEQQ